MSIECVARDESLDLSWLVGHKIEKVVDGGELSKYITLDDGSEWKVVENEGCGGCASGWSEVDLSSLPIDHMITNVEQLGEECNEDEYKLFIYYAIPEPDPDGRMENALLVHVDDGWGNGFYGGGFSVFVKRPGNKQDKELEALFERSN